MVPVPQLHFETPVFCANAPFLLLSSSSRGGVRGLSIPSGSFLGIVVTLGAGVTGMGTASSFGGELVPVPFSS